MEILAFAMALIIESLLWGERAGVGWLTLTIVAFLGTHRLRRRLERGWAPWTLILWSCALAYSAALLWHDGEVVHAVGPWLTLAALGLASFFTVAGPAPLESLTSSWLSLLNAPAMLGQVRCRLSVNARVAQGLLIAAPLVGGFGALFVCADPAFESMLTSRWEAVPHLLRVALFGALLLGMLRYLAWVARPGTPGTPARWDAVSAAVVFASLDALFAAFLVCQGRYLFAGRAPVGMTLAEYARHGFFELFIATVLVLVLVVVCYARLCEEPGQALSLAAVLVLLTLGLVASAVRRMDLYIASFGLTLTRAYVEACLVGIVATLGLTLWALWRRPQPAWLTARLLLLGMVALASVGLADVERMVAQVNVRGAEIDWEYLGQLSADVLPVLDRVKDGASAADRIRQRLSDRDWREWNWAAGQTVDR